MKRRDFIKRSSLGALTAWAGSALLLNACHTEEDMIGEANWIVEGSFDENFNSAINLQQAPFSMGSS